MLTMEERCKYEIHVFILFFFFYRSAVVLRVACLENGIPSATTTSAMAARQIANEVIFMVN